MNTPSRNPANPFAKAVNNIEEPDVQNYLDAFMHHMDANGGSFGSLLSMTLSHGMTDVYNYISHEMASGMVLENLFDYFNIAPAGETAHMPQASARFAMQQVVATTSEDDTAPETDLDTCSLHVHRHSDQMHSTGDAAGAYVYTPLPPASWLVSNITLDFNPPPQAPDVLSLEFSIHMGNSGLNRAGIAPSDPFALSTCGDESHDVRPMDEVVALDDSGTPEEASDDAATLYFTAIQYGGSILGIY